MQIPLVALISIMVIAILGLVYSIFGYKYARFLLPLCGLAIIESLIYLLVGINSSQSGLMIALIYGGTAIAVYAILFFVLRLAAFFTGAAGAGIAAYYIISVFGLSGIPFVIPVAITLAVVMGLISLVYKRVGVIIATSLFGAGLTSATVLYFVFAPGAKFAAEQGIVNGIISVMQQNGYIYFSVFILLVLIGIVIQIGKTGLSQILGDKFKINFMIKKQKEEN